jgi:hypothetical protein
VTVWCQYGVSMVSEGASDSMVSVWCQYGVNVASIWRLAPSTLPSERLREGQNKDRMCVYVCAYICACVCVCVCVCVCMCDQRQMVGWCGCTRPSLCSLCCAYVKV